MLLGATRSTSAPRGPASAYSRRLSDRGGWPPLGRSASWLLGCPPEHLVPIPAPSRCNQKGGALQTRGVPPPTIPCYHPKMDVDHYRENIAATNQQIVDAKADIARQRKIIEDLNWS